MKVLVDADDLALMLETWNHHREYDVHEDVRARLAQALERGPEKATILEDVVRRYLAWGAMTGSDRDLFRDAFTDALAGRRWFEKETDR
jgi:2-keto-3-deoxy-L-rhamnonate aldolase RhmA